MTDFSTSNFVKLSAILKNVKIRPNSSFSIGYVISTKYVRLLIIINIYLTSSVYCH